MLKVPSYTLPQAQTYLQKLLRGLEVSLEDVTRAEFVLPGHSGPRLVTATELVHLLGSSRPRILPKRFPFASHAACSESGMQVRTEQEAPGRRQKLINEA